MNLPISMKFSTTLTHREILCSDLSIPYEGTVLCGIASGDVDVYNMGIPGPFGSEFEFYYKDWNKSGLSGENYKLALALSATNGWGHANSNCFYTDKSSNNYLEEE